MNGRSTILEIATTKYETDRELVSSAMDSLQTLCGVKDGFLISNPMERFGWAFFKILVKTEAWRSNYTFQRKKTGGKICKFHDEFL